MNLKQKIVNLQNKMADNLARKGISDLEKTVVDSDNNVTSKGSSLIDMVNQIPNTWEYVKFDFTGDLSEYFPLESHIIGLSNLTLKGPLPDSYNKIEYLKNIKMTTTNIGDYCIAQSSLKYIENIDFSDTVDNGSVGINQTGIACENLERISGIKFPTDAGCCFVIWVCPALKTLEGIDMSLTDFTDWVPNDSSPNTVLTTVKASGIHMDTDLSNLHAISHESLIYIINNAKTVTDKTLTLGAVNLAKLTDAEKKVATDKGWTLA